MVEGEFEEKNLNNNCAADELALGYEYNIKTEL